MIFRKQMDYTVKRMNEYLALAEKIMKLARNTLLVNLRFLDTAVSRLVMTPFPVSAIGTEGYHIFYDPSFVLRNYKREQNSLSRAYLHCLLHCIFRHMFVNPEIDRPLWDLSCDIAAENSIIDLDLRSVKVANDTEESQHLAELKKKIGILTAEKIYSWLKSHHNHDDYSDRLTEVFTVDDHSFWYMPPESKKPAEDSDGNSDGSPKPSSDQGSGNDNNESDNGDPNTKTPIREELEQMWKHISEQVKTAQEMFSKKQGTMGGGLTQNLKAVTRQRYDYTAFLKQFAVYGEAMKINDDEFDYIFYTYGLSRYGNMPLIEPLEYKEVKRIREFVIAIDTSGSVSGEMVQTFVQKTYNILKSTESFFSKINLHIIQCDAELQEDVRITSQEDFDKYLQTMQIKGLGGTDFRPVFSYVNRLLQEGEFTNLNGLIYFTDGYGTFPERMPDYETAFVFIDDEYNNPVVPPWAIKLVLQRDEI